MNYGYQKSKLDGTEYQFKVISSKIPEEFSCKKDLPQVLDQGSNPTCVPCSISAYMNYKDIDMDIQDVFNHGGTETGMSFKDALHYLRHSDKIKQYAMIGSPLVLKTAIVMNGPCIGGLPVYNSLATNFWNPSHNFEGNHAIAIIGYDKDGFIIRNSWGKSYGCEGYAHMSYDDFNKFLEIWTLI